jgi:hypothetical protein
VRARSRLQSNGFLPDSISLPISSLERDFCPRRLPAWPTGELYFNPFALQFLFVIGAWYSYQCKTVVQSRILLAFAIAYLALSLVVALSWQFKSLDWFLPEEVAKLIYPIDKSHMAWRISAWQKLASMPTAFRLF